MQVQIAKAVFTMAAGSTIAANAKAAKASIIRDVKVIWPQHGQKLTLIGTVEEIGKLIGFDAAVALFADYGITYEAPKAEDEEVLKQERLRDWLRLR